MKLEEDGREAETNDAIKTMNRSKRIGSPSNNKRKQIR